MGQTDIEHQVEEIMIHCRSFYLIMDATVVPQWLDLKYSTAQLKILYSLFRSPKASTISDVAHELGIGVSTTSQLVTKLVQAELVERSEDEHDRRRNILRLTETGKELLEKVHGETWNQIRTWLTRMNAEDSNAFLQGMKALAEIAQKARER